MTKLRIASFIFVAFSFSVPPALWHWLNVQQKNYMTTLPNVDICGLTAMVNFLYALLLATLLSFIAAILAGISYKKLPKPRPKKRLVEWLVISTFFLILLGEAGSFI